MSHPTVDTGRARAWAWIAHLRGGGTTPWRDWTSADSAEHGRFLPGAQQLELLRRLNLAGRPRAALVERVLAASAPGRGRPDLELVGVDEARRFGPPPVDPAALPDDELLRVATGLLAEDLVAADVPVPVVRKPRRFRTRYQLAGDPWLAAALTRRLVADGRPPGGGGRSVHVLGADVATMLGHTWASGAFAEGARPGRTSWPGCGPGAGCRAGSICPAWWSGTTPGRTPAGSASCSTSRHCPDWSAYAGSTRCPTSRTTPPSWPGRSRSR